MYLSGFGNHHQSEALPDALPRTQNSPQQCPYGLYAEQLSGTSFLRPRHLNLHSWLYRILPSVSQTDYEPYLHQQMTPLLAQNPPNPMRWEPLEKPNKSQDFIDGLFHIASAPTLKAYLYQCTISMTTRFFANHDGEMLFVPYTGKLRLHTEFGILEIEPGSIAVIPRGIKYRVELKDNFAAGYICENGGNPLTLPQLGPLGANSLANPRHFLYPHAHFEDHSGAFEVISKFENNYWLANMDHSPLNVVAWHGNYAPYSYDLSLFNTINTVSFDHPDPSIFTVLTSEGVTPGVVNLDFVIFPPRWMVAENTFRPPYFHRNVMNEFMGLVQGTYDAKTSDFSVGGWSIHNCMTAHGPDKNTFNRASSVALKPTYYAHTLAFMFESCYTWHPTQIAYQHPKRQKDYSSCWSNLTNHFKNNS